MNRRTVPLRFRRFAERINSLRPQGLRVKGKQVKCLYDLVTVLEERGAFCVFEKKRRPLRNWEGGFA